MAREQRRLAAIVAADVVGYSRLMGRDESGTLAALKALRGGLVDPKIEEHRGRIVKTTGDGMLVEFASAVDAVRCAVEVQDAIAERNTPVPQDRRIEFRIGIHVGDIIIDGDDIFGDGVNIAARIEGVADAGGIAISRPVHDQIQDRIDVRFVDRGAVELKNIARPVHLFALAREGAAVEAAAPAHAPALTLPDKPSIAVLPFQNMSGDPEHGYFVDGIVADIITELSRFKSLFVIARGSTFTYKGKTVDVRTVASELGVRYILEGSMRRAGDRVRITAQLIDAVVGNQLWAERYDRTLEDVFAVQEEVTRSIVMAVAPGVEMAQEAQAERIGQAGDAAQLAWRAQGLYSEALRMGGSAKLLNAIAVAQQAIAADPNSLSVLECLTVEYWYCHLVRWGPEPEKALDAAWSIAQRMTAIDPMDFRTLIACGLVRVARGERERGIADLRRAIEHNPNSSTALVLLAFAEATVGLAAEAKEHALLAIRLSPRDTWIGTAQLAVAMASFAMEDYAEAMRWGELSIQSDPLAPTRRAIMIACCARAGDLQKAAQERATLDGFAPQFVASVLRGENRIFTRTEDREHLIDGLQLAGYLPDQS